MLVEMLVEIAPEAYTDYVTYENNNKIVCVSMLKPLHVMLKASILYYKQFVKDITEIGYEINPYDPCVANKLLWVTNIH